jgi:hypothetical protein
MYYMLIMKQIQIYYQKITNQQWLTDQDACSTLLAVNSMCICWAIETMMNNPVFHISNLNKTCLLFIYSTQIYSANILGKKLKCHLHEIKIFLSSTCRLASMNTHSPTSWKKLSLSSSDDKPRLDMSTFWMLQLFVLIETFKHLHVISIAIRTVQRYASTKIKTKGLNVT